MNFFAKQLTVVLCVNNLLLCEYVCKKLLLEVSLILSKTLGYARKKMINFTKMCLIHILKGFGFISKMNKCDDKEHNQYITNIFKQQYTFLKKIIIIARKCMPVCLFLI